MTMERKTRTIASLSTGGRNEIERAIKRLSNSIDAIFLKQILLLRESIHVISGLRDFMRKEGIDKPIIVDYRLEEPDLHGLHGISTLFKDEGAYGMTALGIFEKDFFVSCKEKAEIAMFAIIDIGVPFFRESIDDALIIRNAVFAKENGFEGVIMTSRYPDRIRKVKNAVRNDLLVLATLAKESKLGDAISVGADFEIVPYELLEK